MKENHVHQVYKCLEDHLITILSMCQITSKVEDGPIEKFMKSNPTARLLKSQVNPTKMYWADDLKQWEVFISNPNSRALEYIYQGKNLAAAIAALTGETS